MTKILLIIAIFLITAMPAYAEQEPKTLTRADVIEKLSASEFFKKKIGDLLNFNIGYDITKINRTSLAPTISFIKATPIKVPPDNRTVFLLTAKVSDPSGPDNIRGVRADLSSINKLSNMMLVDNGLWGDTNPSDNVYTLQTAVGLDVDKGSKDIPVAVSNKMGWVAVAKTSLDVERNPIIQETKATPPSVASDGATNAILTAKIENPGRQEDMDKVLIDLTVIGGGNGVPMLNDGTGGDAKKGDKYYTLTVTVKPGTPRGLKKLSFLAYNNNGGVSNGEIMLEVR